MADQERVLSIEQFVPNDLLDVMIHRLRAKIPNYGFGGADDAARAMAPAVLIWLADNEIRAEELLALVRRSR